MAVVQPCGVTFGNGKVYFTEPGADLVRRLDVRTGVLGTAAGTGTTGLDLLSGLKAALDHPCGTVVDAAGNLVFAEGGNNNLVRVAARDGTFYGVAMRAGPMYAVAGGGFAHGTQATMATLVSPAVAADLHRNLVVSSGTV